MNGLHERLIDYRRDLHRIPELDRDLPKTTAYLRKHLLRLPCEIIEIGDAGFCAFFNRGKQETVAFRADMDAIPIEEKTGVPFRSMHPGRMHACGHDGHMSILLGLATVVAERMELLADNVLLVFQAAEETTGGAMDICESGIFQRCRVKKIYGLHLWPGFPKDQIICRCHEFMASTMVIYADIEGKSAHIGAYREGIDALAIGARFINLVYEMEKSEIAPGVYRLLKFGRFNSGTAVNIVPAAARIEGTLRTFSEIVHQMLWTRLTEIAEDLSCKTGCKITLGHSEPYPAVINPKKLFSETKATLSKAGFDFMEPAEPMMQAEDFSWYQKYVPGIFFHLGTGINATLHNPTYQIDEDVLLTGVKVFQTLLGIPD